MASESRSFAASAHLRHGNHRRGHLMSAYCVRKLHISKCQGIPHANLKESHYGWTAICRINLRISRVFSWNDHFALCLLACFFPLFFANALSRQYWMKIVYNYWLFIESWHFPSPHCWLYILGELVLISFYSPIEPRGCWMFIGESVGLGNRTSYGPSPQEIKC